MQRHRYHIDIFWSAEDDAWIADVPDRRYCSARGDSSAEAVQEIEAAPGKGAPFRCRAVVDQEQPARGKRP